MVRSATSSTLADRTILYGLDNFVYASSSTSTIPTAVNAFSFATSTAAAPILSIDGLNGRVGIGTTSPGARLNIQIPSGIANKTAILLSGSSDSSAAIRRDTDTGYMELWGGDDWNTGGTIALMGNSSVDQSQGAIEFQLHKTTSKFYFLDLSANSLMALTHAGGLGIGTTTPNNKLDIYSTTKSAIGFSGASGDTYKWTMGMDVSNGGRFSIASSTALGTNDRFVIDGNGNAG